MATDGYRFRVPKATHMISVRTTSQSASDSKSFSISCPLSTEKLYGIIYKFSEKQLPKIFEQKIIFTDVPNRRTHMILIFPKNESEKGRTVGITYPTYSAAEIARELQKHLCGESEI